MSIKVQNSNTAPAVEFKYLHLSECHINMATNQAATTEVKAIFIPYGFDANGQKVFSSTGEINLQEKDFLLLAKKRAAAGDPTYLEAITAIEAGFAKLLAEKVPALVGEVEQVL